MDKALAEKLEALQNIMLASVTGGARDEESYKDIRDELLAMPSLKEALPRFVRTCATLIQLWHFFKKDGSFPSYASRREYIWNGFKPLLEGDDDSALDREIFFARGSEHDAYVHIRAILQLAQTSLFIIDPYMDASIYQLLGTINAVSLDVRILTSKAPSDFALEGQKFVRQHGGITLEIRKTKDFHDRFILLDGGTCYLLGASIKDAGNRGFTVVPLEDLAFIQFFSSYASQVWAAATPF